MLDKIKQYFQAPAETGEMSEQHRRLACAALLIEVAVIDNEFDGKELAALKTVLNQQFGIAGDEVDALITHAHKECTEATSTYQFTQQVNQHCDATEKFELIKGMWRIAFADGNLDKYEEYIVRKVSDLIYLSQADFIRAKQAARQSPSSPGGF